MNVEFKTVEEYIACFPKEVQEILLQVRNTILQHAPQATEGIAYGMPAYKLKGKPLVYFGGYQKHIGFYATPTGHSKFEIELASYKQGKGSVQFPLREPIPFELIGRIVEFRVSETLDKFK
ncbi:MULTISPECIES: iron chaperone [unclassified Sphingobacterium]|uniref:iron chaperone n=1 Tax=unclassified Sphingobacterium TaxID=2609468 RepID=UPI00104A2FCB|nr:MULTISPECIES: DUF1801 domain-containing protein [unclassified Sphingobacterium]MCS3553766.1 uncharacterized protein YdhG (YjbR/CyaY superfamily) [Sphingobacterium sp. JUb21]TCR01394.1 uncharacterized protein YdhG (YjbR/CyaY superfamily) [Sphingobacterium sp. JUb20]